MGVGPGNKVMQGKGKRNQGKGGGLDESESHTVPDDAA